ncbi:HpcH/HpaI aldolase family protein [Arthrobacter gengyunqii]|uniref:HpcH/HpaI aldolase/citrate lyase family protein n=1 Tax=Arthrobacter gengyunqii TaxID=2886940 RepID=A0ABS8GDX7_9MICC|nr:HpcH/HpaI aldolase/citrate lyase family protein [Arthrobacter gengyunqii]MCC3264822.1 HpcH/HpaI aldolase/citrate lyase family protein [Arthrobacter gengyunqii]
MPLRVTPEETFAARLAAGGRQTGMWVCSGSPLVAEICAGAGLDWLLFDAEHSPNGLESLLAQLQAVHGYPVAPVVRPPSGDPVLIKQYLDLGAQNLLIPMVDTAEQAAELVRAVQYPPHGIRGVGSALARASRWNRIDGYLQNAGDSLTLLVQIETAAAVANVAEIAAVDGVDGLFIGPSDLAASMGHLGQQDHPEVVAAVEHCIREIKAAGKPVGVNAFAEATARRYIDAGADFILVGADVALLARGSEALAATYISSAGDDARASY